MFAAPVTGARNKSPSWLSMTLVFINVGAAAVFVWALLGFGSIGSAWAYVHGLRLLVDAYTKSVGIVEQGQNPAVAFQLTNHYDQPVTIVGARAACGCVVTSDLPMLIPAHGRRTIRVTVRTGQKQGPINEPVQLLTDAAGQPRINLRVGGSVSTSAGRAPSAGSGPG